MIKILEFFSLAFFGVSPSTAKAGEVRDVYVNEDKMCPVYMALGQSTVIRFDDKPLKVVVGNQNYLNVEFIGKDITIQPQKSLTTNLFVYGEHGRVYGFIVEVGSDQKYDDLVNAHWKHSSGVRLAPIKQEPLKAKEIDIEIGIPLEIDVQFESLKEVSKNRTFAFDGYVENTGKGGIDLSQVELKASREGRPFAKMTYAFDEDELSPGEIARIRMIIDFGQIHSFTLHLKTIRTEVRTIISKEIF